MLADWVDKDKHAADTGNNIVLQQAAWVLTFLLPGQLEHQLDRALIPNAVGRITGHGASLSAGTFTSP